MLTEQLERGVNAMKVDLDELRNAIDTKYAEAVAALSVLRNYIADESESPPRKPAEPSKPSKPPTLAGGGRIRDQVLGVLRTGFFPAQHVVKQTGLTMRQVRGVITAPDMKGSMERRTANGVKEYHYRDDPSTT